MTTCIFFLWPVLILIIAGSGEHRMKLSFIEMSDLQDASETLYNSFGIKMKDQMCSVSPVLQTECISLSWAPTVSNLYSPFPVHVPPLLPAYTHTHTQKSFSTLYLTLQCIFGGKWKGVPASFWNPTSLIAGIIFLRIMRLNAVVSMWMLWRWQTLFIHRIFLRIQSWRRTHFTFCGF